MQYPPSSTSLRRGTKIVRSVDKGCILIRILVSVKGLRRISDFFGQKKFSRAKNIARGGAELCTRKWLQWWRCFGTTFFSVYMYFCFVNIFCRKENSVIKCQFQIHVALSIGLPNYFTKVWVLG